MEKSKNIAVCIICGVLTVFGIVASVISLFNGKDSWIAKDIMNVVLSLLIGYYAISGYSRPKGNLLKYIILIFAADYLISIYALAQLGKPWLSVCISVIIGLCCYVAGRLHRVKQNIVLMMIAVVFILIVIFAFMRDSVTLGVLTQLVIWIDICAAYFLRYKEHKEAGRANAGEK